MAPVNSSSCFLKNQTFVFAGGEFVVAIDLDEDVRIPESARGKVEVRHVTMVGFTRRVTFVALKNVYVDTSEFVVTEDDRAFEAYRCDLEAFLEYRAGLAETFDEL